MKTIKLIFFMLLLFAMMQGFTGCSNDENKNLSVDESKRIENKLTASKEVEDFFNMALPNEGQESHCFFTSLNPQKDICYVVNSRDEFLSLYSCSEALPDIDFDKQSLIIGMSMLSGGYKIEEFDVEETSEAIVINLSIRKYEGTSFTALFPNYYWGLYNKLHNKIVTTKNHIEE